MKIQDSRLRSSVNHLALAPVEIPQPVNFVFDEIIQNRKSTKLFVTALEINRSISLKTITTENLVEVNMSIQYLYPGERY